MIFGIYTPIVLAIFAMCALPYFVITSVDMFNPMALLFAIPMIVILIISLGLGDQ